MSITVTGKTIFTAQDLIRFERLLMQYKLAIKSQLKRNRQWTTGKTWNSIDTVVNATPTALEAKLTSPNAIALNTLETGRKPGAVPNDFAQIIYDWSIAKGLSFSTDKERWQFANAVKWKTIKEGNLAFRTGTTFKVWTNLEAAYQQKILDLLDTITKSKIVTILDSFKP